MPLHADAIVFTQMRSLGGFVSCSQTPYNRNDPSQRAPTSDKLNFLARHRQESPGNEGSSADEDVSTKNSGWVDRCRTSAGSWCWPHVQRLL